MPFKKNVSIVLGTVDDSHTSNNILSDFLNRQSYKSLKLHFIM